MYSGIYRVSFIKYNDLEYEIIVGLTCNEQNCIQKGNVQASAARNNMGKSSFCCEIPKLDTYFWDIFLKKLFSVVICPDTSPRGLGIEGEDDSWDFGTGAGFYVNATEEKWAKYQMYEYVTSELPKVIQNVDILNGKLTGKHAITGHSMGGHGALICALKNPGKYVSASAFAPISAPMKCPWGDKCFSNYLGSDKSKWEQYDASVLAG